MLPLVTAVYMGLGHLRAALPLAEALGVPLRLADQPPVCGPVEAATWTTIRRGYEALSRRATEDRLAAAALHTITRIPADPGPRPADGATWTLAASVALGVGAGIVRVARAEERPVLSTFYVPAIAADAAGVATACVVTDTDCARAWAPANPARSTIQWYAPVDEVRARLLDYGVRPERIDVTGFPLPPRLLSSAEVDLAARLDRLSGRAPLRVLLAIGGAGAQLDTVREMLRAPHPGIEYRISAGVRPEVARALAEFDVPVDVGIDFADHARRFAEALHQTDVLWTKPSELTFYAALGVPLALAAPVGVQEERNAAWLDRHGLRIDTPADLVALRDAGTLSRVAERAFTQLNRAGTATIAAAYAAPRSS